MTSHFAVRRADWDRDREHLRAVRLTVFVHEQGVPPDLEWDEADAQCVHVLAENGAGVSIGTGRLLPDGHIGRMAVLAAWRGRGVGGAMLTELMRIAQEHGFTEVVLNAQTRAIPFYAQHGFREEGEEFLDAGIPHRRMRRAL